MVCFAQDTSPLQGSISVAKIVRVKDQEGKYRFYRYKNVEEAKPGDILEYDIVYVNVSQKILGEIKILGPIPQNTFFYAGTLKSKNTTEMLASLDGGKEFSKPPLKKKVEKDGKAILVEVSEKEWTHIQCLVPRLMPGEDARVRYWVIVK
ncbi:MAG: hypothetical protein HUU50_01150 [Candidatus Brocadiae bacterium]|nr:hypothetical protein [Candidatus Brocadiia bacterium]